ncbi:MAG TPA: hypothetical protein VE398_06430 [Acidobacteriota bacterium]|nr:hypothetical protein [Acidobacteriota bacterium]
MPARDIVGGYPNRRAFVSALLSTVLFRPVLEASSADDIYVLPEGDFSRLRSDFNANLARIRLVFMLSPT